MSAATEVENANHQTSDPTVLKQYTDFLDNSVASTDMEEDTAINAEDKTDSHFDFKNASNGTSATHGTANEIFENFVDTKVDGTGNVDIPTVREILADNTKELTNDVEDTNSTVRMQLDNELPALDVAVEGNGSEMPMEKEEVVAVEDDTESHAHNQDAIHDTIAPETAPETPASSDPNTLSAVNEHDAFHGGLSEAPGVVSMAESTEPPLDSAVKYEATVALSQEESHPSDATAEAPVEDTVASSHLSASQAAEVERPKSPWTPSYSVTTQGPGIVNEEEIPGVPLSAGTSADATGLDEPRPSDPALTPPVAFEDSNTPAIADDKPLIEESGALHSDTPVLAPLDITNDASGSPTQPPSHEVAEANVADDMESSSHLSAAQAAEIERPKSPWTPSYSVTTQGPGIAKEDEIPEVPLLSPTAETSFAEATVLDEPRPSDPVPAPPVAFEDNNTSALADDEPLIEERVDSDTPVIAPLDIANDASGSPTQPPSHEVAEANIVDDTEASSHLSAAQTAEVERPKSPWTPSYSVTTQGPGIANEKDIPEVPLLTETSFSEATVLDEPRPSDTTPAPPVAFEDNNTSALADEPLIEERVDSDTPVTAPLDIANDANGSPTQPPSHEAAEANIADDTETSSHLSAAQAAEVERPKSPWTSSYSVTTQGSAVANEEEIPEVPLLSPSTETSFAEAAVLDEPRPFDTAPAPPMAFEDSNTSAIADDKPLIEESGLHNDTPVIAPLDIANDASGSPTQLPSHEVAEANIADDTEASLHLSAAQAAEIERPKSPWTPSYSVTTQGPGIANEEDIPEVPLLLPSAQTEATVLDELTPSSAPAAPVAFEDGNTSANTDNEPLIEEPVESGSDGLVFASSDLDNDANGSPTQSPSLEVVEANFAEAPFSEVSPTEEELGQKEEAPVGIAETGSEHKPDTDTEASSHLSAAQASEIERPKSPWTPSYSVTTQGPGIANEEEIPEAPLLSQSTDAMDATLVTITEAEAAPPLDSPRPKSPIGQKDTEEIPVGETGSEPLTIDIDTERDTEASLHLSSAQAAEVERPKSPWTASYSVTTQGPAITNGEEVPEAPLLSPSDATAEPAIIAPEPTPPAPFISELAKEQVIDLTPPALEPEVEEQIVHPDPTIVLREPTPPPTMTEPKVEEQVTEHQDPAAVIDQEFEAVPREPTPPPPVASEVEHTLPIEESIIEEVVHEDLEPTVEEQAIEQQDPAAVIDQEFEAVPREPTPPPPPVASEVEHTLPIEESIIEEAVHEDLEPTVEEQVIEQQDPAAVIDQGLDAVPREPTPPPPVASEVEHSLPIEEPIIEEAVHEDLEPTVEEQVTEQQDPAAVIDQELEVVPREPTPPPPPVASEVEQTLPIEEPIIEDLESKVEERVIEQPELAAVIDQEVEDVPREPTPPPPVASEVEHTVPIEDLGSKVEERVIEQPEPAAVIDQEVEDVPREPIPPPPPVASEVEHTVPIEEPIIEDLGSKVEERVIEQPEPATVIDQEVEDVPREATPSPPVVQEVEYTPPIVDSARVEEPAIEVAQSGPEVMLVNDAPVAVDIETEHAPTVSSADTADETLRFDPAAEVIGGHLEPLREDSGPHDALVDLPAVPVVEAELQLSEVDTTPIALGINPPVSDDHHKAAIESGVIVDPSTLHDPDAQDDSPDPSSDAVVAALIESGVLADQPEQADANPDALLGAIPESFEDHPNEDDVEDLPWSTAVPDVEPKKAAAAGDEPEGLPTREDVVETDRSTSSEPSTIQTSLATGYSAPERPISPWTSSYSVTNQGRPSEAGAEDVSDREVFEEQNHFDEPIADSTSLDASLEPPRASSPWTRSYSVSVQGSPLPTSAQLAEDASVPVSDHEMFEEHDHMDEPIPDSASLDASLEPPRASSPWTPSYSVSVQGSPLPTSAQLTADVDKEDTPVVHDASAEFSATREIENIAEPPTSSVEDISDFIAESVAEAAPIAPTEESSHGEATSDVVIDESLDSTATFASTVPAHGEFEPIHADPAVLAAVPVDSASGDASAELEPVLEQKATTLALQDTLQGVADSGDLSADLAAESVPAQAPKDVITGETSSAVDAPAAAATATPADSPGIPVIVLQDVPHMEKEAVPVLEQTVDDAAAARANGTETVNIAVEQDTNGIATTQLAPSTADQFHDTPLELSVEPPLEVTEPLVSSETVEPHGVVSHSQDSVPAPVEHINSPPAVAPEADAEISTPPTSETPTAFPLMLDVSGSTPNDESVLDPPLSPRSRLESTASSMFFPGGWFSKVPEGRASFDVAQGEFSQPKSPKIPSIPPPTASPTAPPTAPPAAETRESEEKKGKWCVVM